MRKYLSVLLILLFVAVFSALSTTNQTVTGETGNDSTGQQQPAIDPVVIVARRWMPRDLLGLLLPITVRIMDQNRAAQSVELNLVDFYYIGPDNDPTKGRLLAVALPGNGLQQRRRQLLAPDQATLPLGEIARNILARAGNEQDVRPPWVCVMVVNASWTPWTLTLSSVDAAVSGNLTQQTSRVILTALRNREQPFLIKSLDTSRVNIPIAPNKSIMMKAGVGFAPGEFIFTLLPAEVATHVGLGQLGRANPSIGQAPAEASTVMQLPFSTLRYIFGTQLKGGPITASIGEQDLRARDLSVVAVDEGINISGEIDPSVFEARFPSQGSPPKFRFNLHYNGDDLRLQNDDDTKIVKIDCGGLEPIDCSLLNLALVNGLNDFSERGVLLRTQGVIKYDPLNLSGRLVDVNSYFLRVSRSDQLLQVSGHITLRDR